MKQINQLLFYKNRAISFTCADWSRAMVDAVQSKAKRKRRNWDKNGSRSRRGRYQTKITGHRLQVHVNALLINNWDKQFTPKLKLYFGLWLRLGDTLSVVYLIVTRWPVLYPDLRPETCHLGFVPAVPGDMKNTLTTNKLWTFER